MESVNNSKNNKRRTDFANDDSNQRKKTAKLEGIAGYDERREKAPGDSLAVEGREGVSNLFCGAGVTLLSCDFPRPLTRPLPSSSQHISAKIQHIAYFDNKLSLW